MMSFSLSFFCLQSFCFFYEHFIWSTVITWCSATTLIKWTNIRFLTDCLWTAWLNVGLSCISVSIGSIFSMWWVFEISASQISAANQMQRKEVNEILCVVVEALKMALLSTVVGMLFLNVMPFMLCRPQMKFHSPLLHLCGSRKMLHPEKSAQLYLLVVANLISNFKFQISSTFWIDSSAQCWFCGLKKYKWLYT